MKFRYKLDRILDSSSHRRAVLVTFDLFSYLFINGFYYLVAAAADNSMPVDPFRFYITHVLLQLALTMAFRGLFGIYQTVWRYANTVAYFSLVLADTLGSLLTLVLLRIANIFIPGIYQGVWQAVSTGAMAALLTLLSRFCYTMIYSAATRTRKFATRVPVAVVGAGRLGTYLVGDLRNNPNSGYEPMFFVDRDNSKIGNMVSQLKVYDSESGDTLLKKLGIREVLIAIAGSDGDELEKLFCHYRNLGCKVRIYDSLVDSARAQKGILREFSINDLLARSPREVVTQVSREYYCGKTVLVTGGGGSIGSELCRQIARSNPKKLIIFDIYENNAYDIQQELLRSFGTDWILRWRSALSGIRTGWISCSIPIVRMWCSMPPPTSTCHLWSTAAPMPSSTTALVPITPPMPRKNTVFPSSFSSPRTRPLIPPISWALPSGSAK